ncbi:MAG: hypothetical protein WCO72_15100, partial [Betaproteobacteria bacterium]
QCCWHIGWGYFPNRYSLSLLLHSPWTQVKSFQIRLLGLGGVWQSFITRPQPLGHTISPDWVHIGLILIAF